MSAITPSITPLIEVENGAKQFGSFSALSDINLRITEGEIVTLLGPSGCGKTTLMRIFAGFETLTSGTLKMDGKPIDGVAPEKRPVNMVFQRYALFPHLDVFENVSYGLKVKGIRRDERRDRVKAMLNIVQMDHLAHRYISELSGGQCQRVALARALVNRPRVLLLDEPLAALDLKIRQHMLGEMKRIQVETKSTFVYVTHDQDEAMILSDRVTLMEKGKIIQIDTPRRMYRHPNSLFAAKFLGETNLFPGRVIQSGHAKFQLETSDGAFEIDPSAADVGNDAVMCVRPETITFGSGNPEDDYSLTAHVNDVIFTGSRTFFHLKSAAGQAFRVQVQNIPNVTLPSVGDKVDVAWRKDSVSLVPQ